MLLKSILLLVNLFLLIGQSYCQRILNNFYERTPRSKLRDLQFSDIDTSLAINFENVNDKQFPFYLHCEKNYKFSMDQFTEEFIQISYKNLVNKTEPVDGMVSLRKVEKEHKKIAKPNELAHYEMLINTGKFLTSFCMNLTYGNSHWYGAPSNPGVHFPIDPKLVMQEQPYIGGRTLAPDSTGSVIEYVWLSSAGFAVFIEREVPLFFSIENGIFCLKARNDLHPYNRTSSPKNRPLLKGHLIIAKDVKQAYLYYLDNFVERPERSPNPLAFKVPIWTTWVQFKTNINQNNLIEFAKKIKDNGFTKYGAVFEIDDKWEEHYGNAKFDSNRFPDAKKMMSEIKKLGFNTSVWLTPFFNREVVDNDLTAAEKDLMIKKMNSTDMLRINWWQGKNATCIDFTNPRSRTWFKKRIQKLLSDYNIDTFKADAGEISWFDSPFKLFQQDADLAPNKYSEYYSLFIKNFESPLFIEMRASFNSQKHGNVIRLLDKETLWSYKNGLQSLLPHYLTYSIFGYPYVLPDIVGGNAYVRKPDKELYLRWLAANSLLPMVQYSIAPFDYDEESIKIGLKFQELHNEFVPLFVELAENAKTTGEPIIRPVWWIAPEDSQTWTIGDQFLIGDNVLVAPILEQNKTSRRIYLPAGNWSDALKNVNITGPKYLDNYEIKLDEIAYFHKIKN